MLKLLSYKKSVDDLQFLKVLNKDVVGFIIELLDFSESQLCQDLFVLAETGLKTNGYFVEFGATNGVELSNTYLLEKRFNWNGILAEPAKIWHQELRRNRGANIDFDCVWVKTGDELEFVETAKAQLSTIDSFVGKDMHAKAREDGKRYLVQTVSLMDLLERYSAPRHIDYLSIDTEGSELKIMENFDFDAYQFSVITCEHNFTKDREKIHDLLTSKGYARKFESISKFDDWYVKQ